MKLVAAYLLAGPAAVTAALGFLAYGEHAAVTVTVVAQRVQVQNAPLGGGNQGGGLVTKQIVASAGEQQTVTSSVVQLAATTATGQVTFMCSPMTSCPNGYTVARGTLLESTAGVEYQTLSSASFPSCAPSSPVSVQAVTAGSAGNAAGGTVVYGQFPSYIHVDNASPIVGGADSRSVHVVQQSDIDTASTALMARVSSDLTAKVRTQAAGLSYLTYAAPAFSTSSDAPVGADAPTFTLTVAGTVHAIAYSARDADALLRRALLQSAPAGYRLTSDRIDATYSVQSTGEIVGSATAFAVPSVSTKTLANAIRGQSLSAARTQVGHSVPGAVSDIQITPFALPWLPVLSGNISIAVAVVRGAD